MDYFKFYRKLINEYQEEIFDISNYKKKLEKNLEFSENVKFIIDEIIKSTGGSISKIIITNTWIDFFINGPIDEIIEKLENFDTVHIEGWKILRVKFKKDE